MMKLHLGLLPADLPRFLRGERVTVRHDNGCMVAVDHEELEFSPVTVTTAYLNIRLKTPVSLTLIEPTDEVKATY